MEITLIIVLSIVCLLVVIWAMIERSRMIQLPFLASVVFLGWVLPQLLGLVYLENLEVGFTSRTTIMCIGCLLAIVIGYSRRVDPLTTFNASLSTEKLKYSVILMSILGIYSFLKMSELAPTAESQWSGTITIYAFFATLNTTAFAIAVVLFIKQANWVSIIVIVVNLLLYFDRIVIWGRRNAMVELLLFALVGAWFSKRIKPSRLFMVAMIAVGTLAVTGISEYRSIAKDATSFMDIVDELTQGKFLEGGFKEAMIDGGNEMRNAAFGIEAAAVLGSYDYGLSLWNALIHRYIPGQLIGEENKASLMFQIEDSSWTVFSYTPIIGSTTTGFSSSYNSFGFAGVFVFYVLAVTTKKLWVSGEAGNIPAQVLSLLLPPNALLAITHHHESFFLPFVQWAIFLIPVYLYCKEQSRQ